MNISVSKRYNHIDYLKGIGILLIMFAHVVQNFPPMNMANVFVRTFHVPIFFITSGYLMGIRDMASGKDVRDIKTFISKRAKALLIPYAIFSIFNSMLKFAVLSLTGAISGEIIRDELRQLLITGNGTVWFLLTLFLVELVFSICVKPDISKRNIGIIAAAVVMVLLLAGPFYISADNDFKVVFIRVVEGSGYYILGYIVSILAVKSKIMNLVCGVLLIIAGSVAAVLMKTDTDFYNGSFHYICGSLMAAVSLSVGLLIIFYNIENGNREGKICNILKYYGTNSLIVMLVHPTVLLFITYPIGSRFSVLASISGIAVSIAVFIILCVLQIPFVYIINRYLPFIIGKTKAK